MIFFKKIAFAGAVLTVALPLAVFAQTAAPTTGAETKAVAFADISLINVHSTETNGTISGNYSIQGGMGKQNNIYVGVLAYDEKSGAIVNTATLQSGLSVQQGQIISFPFSYKIPTYLSGTFKFVLIAETDSGLPLGVAILSTKTLSGSGSSVACALSDTTKAVISCSAKEDTMITVSYTPGSFFTKTTSSETKNIKKGGNVSFTPSLPIGKYAAHVATQKNGEESAVRFRMPGDYGSITSIVVNSTTPGTVHGVVVADTTQKGASLTLTLTSSLGKSCGTMTQPVAGVVSEFEIKTSCTDGTVQVELVGSNGSKLDSKSESFSTVVITPKASSQAQQFSRSAGLIGFGFLVIIILALGWYVYSRRKMVAKSTVVALALFAFFSGSANHAHAYSYALYFVHCSSACPAAASIYGTVSASSGPYSPGSSIGVSIFVTSDDNPQYPSGVSPVAEVALDGGAYGPDLFPGTYTQAQIMSGITAVTSLTAPSTSGTHYINWLGSSAGYNTATGATAFTVQSITPTVNVNFSSLPKSSPLATLSH